MQKRSWFILIGALALGLILSWRLLRAVQVAEAIEKPYTRAYTLSEIAGILAQADHGRRPGSPAGSRGPMQMPVFLPG